MDSKGGRDTGKAKETAILVEVLLIDRDTG
jgi:hypothetical protein